MPIAFSVRLPEHAAASLEDRLTGAGHQCARITHGENAAVVVLGVVAHSLLILDILYHWFAERRTSPEAVPVTVLLPDGTQVPLEAASPESLARLLQPTPSDAPDRGSAVETRPGNSGTGVTDSAAPASEGRTDSQRES